MSGGFDWVGWSLIKTTGNGRHYPYEELENPCNCGGPVAGNHGRGTGADPRGGACRRTGGDHDSDSGSCYDGDGPRDRYGHGAGGGCELCADEADSRRRPRSEEHTSDLQSLMRISYAAFCLKKQTHITSH